MWKAHARYRAAQQCTKDQLVLPLLAHCDDLLDLTDRPVPQALDVRRIADRVRTEVSEVNGRDEQERVSKGVAGRRVTFGNREGEGPMLGHPELIMRDEDSQRQFP